MIENELDRLLNKTVRLIKLDGYVKIGTLKHINASFVEIVYTDGKFEIVPFSQIKSVIAMEA